MVQTGNRRAFSYIRVAFEQPVLVLRAFLCVRARQLHHGAESFTDHVQKPVRVGLLATRNRRCTRGLNVRERHIVTPGIPHG